MAALQVPVQHNTHWLLELLLGLTGKTGKCLTQGKFDCKSPKFRVKKQAREGLCLGTPPVVQWLGFCSLPAKGLGSIPGWGTKIS